MNYLKHTIVPCLLVVGVFSLSSCHQDSISHSKVIKKATVTLQSTAGNTAQGNVSFETVENGVKIIADIQGLKPGVHGFHIHEKGDCSAPDASSAGGHYNPDKHDHGAPDVKNRHVGDLGNITADESGHAHYERVDTVIKLDGANSIIGKSVIVHANADDYTTQPTGNAGGRVACGMIVESNR